ncbi:MAG: immunoglobulin-like domain-containing protein [Candidatus Paceibacterota bacterium]
MKKINNIVFGLLVATLFAGVTPGVVFAADNESISLAGVDARTIVTNGTTSYVSNFNNTNVSTLDFSLIPPALSATASLVGDGAYGLSFASGNLFIAAGKYDSASTYGGLQVLGTSAIYGKTDTYTYSKVFAVSGGSAFSAFLDGSYIPYLEAVSYDGASTITPVSDVALDTTSVNDITALTISGSNAYVGIQDSSNAGYVKVVDTSTMTSTGTYTTTDTITSVTVSGSNLYVGHGNKVDVVDTSGLSLSSTIETGATVNGLATDGTYLYVANANGLRVYTLSGSFVGERNTTMSATAVSVDGGFIYVATSNGTNSEVFKIKMVVITLTGANPQTIEFGAGYTELGATVSDGSTPVITSDFVDAIGSYTVTYTAVDASSNPGFQVTRTVNVSDTTAPTITLLGANPQNIQQGSGYTELGATTNDGSSVQINTSAFVDAVGSYVITYDSVDASGNHATQVERRVNVTGPVGGGGGGSGGGGSSGDTTPPTDTSISISAGATSTATLAVSLTLGATGATQMIISNDAGFAGASWETYATSRAWTLTSGDGLKTVYAKFKDAAGNISAAISDTITVSGSGTTTTTTGSIPGCTGTTGYSITTGQSCAGNTGGQVLGAEKFIFTLFLKQTTPPPYPKLVAYVNEVKELQKFLNAAPYNSGLVVDGKFGPLTKAAVIKFQLANGLVGDGKVGPLTRAVLNK